VSAIAVEDYLTRLRQLGPLGATRMTARDTVPQHFAAGFPQSHHSGHMSGVDAATLRGEQRLGSQEAACRRATSSKRVRRSSREGAHCMAEKTVEEGGLATILIWRVKNEPG
jgi:hypothetical protein